MRAAARAASVPACPPPTTITSKSSGKFIVQGRAAAKRESIDAALLASRSVTGPRDRLPVPRGTARQLFHVKQAALEEARLLAESRAVSLVEEALRGKRFVARL